MNETHRGVASLSLFNGICQFEYDDVTSHLRPKAY